jgi:dTMP kinase
VDPAWLRRLYGYAIQPDVTIYFRLPLEVALSRILHGRPRLKWFEAGMDMDLSYDIYESFTIFQGRIKEQYDGMVDEFGFEVVDATRNVHEQQDRVRRVIRDTIDLSKFESRVEWPTNVSMPIRRRESTRSISPEP